MPMGPQSAAAIAQGALDKTGAALMSGDIEAFLPVFLLPQELETFEGRRTLTTTAEVRAVFAAVCAHFANSGVTDMVRTCVSAAFKGADRIEFTHETRLLCRNQLVQAPYPVFTVLRLVDGDWKVAHSVYAITDSPHHSRALLYSVPSDSPPDPAG